MPELPEVETIARQLSPIIVGRRIQHVQILRPSLLQTPVAGFKKTLETQKILCVQRRGKYLLFQLENGYWWVTHLRMTGKYICLDLGDQKLDTAKKAKLIFKLGSKNLIYQDTRCLGKLGVYPQIPDFIHQLGPEPLSAAFSLKVFDNILKKRKTNLKNVLLNQQAIAGIGNIYASEALFAARLHPARTANSLKPAESAQLYTALKHLLQSALKHNGTTIQDFQGVNQKTGQFQNFLQVYGKQNTPCKVCNTVIQRIVQQQRSTFLCPKCQKL